MNPGSANLFTVGNDEYSFEIVEPYTKRPLQLLDEGVSTVDEDRFHRTVKATRLRDSRSWVGAGRHPGFIYERPARISATMA